MLRTISEIQPRWIVGENVGGILNWSDGMVFEQIHLDLEAAGYEVQAFVLPAAGVNAPHRRDRVWFVAYRAKSRCKHGQVHNRWSEEATRIGQISNIIGDTSKNRPTPDTDGNGTQGQPANFGTSKETRQGRQDITKTGYNEPAGDWANFPTQPPICRRNDGIPTELDGITFSKWRNESIKAYGNAIVPQVAMQIFNAINQYENQI